MACNSRGAAAYPNGAVAKLGAGAPYMRFQRYFLRQIIGLGGEREQENDEGSRNETLEATQNQLAGKVDKNRITITVGKFAVGDVFDDNVYAHDPTTGFLNFAFNTLGAFDYALTPGVTPTDSRRSGNRTGGLPEQCCSSSRKSLWDRHRAGAVAPIYGCRGAGSALRAFGQPGEIKFLAYGDNGLSPTSVTWSTTPFARTICLRS